MLIVTYFARCSAIKSCKPGKAAAIPAVLAGGTIGRAKARRLGPAAPRGVGASRASSFAIIAAKDVSI